MTLPSLLLFALFQGPAWSAPPANFTGNAAGLDPTVSCTNNANVNINSGNLYIDCTNTRVGINTASPQQILHVLGTASSRAIMVNSPQAAATGVSGTPVAELAIFAEPYGSANTSMLDILAYSTGTANPLFRIANHWENTASPATSSSGTISFGWYTGSTYTDVLNLSTVAASGSTSGGSVGIGTLNPATNLDISGNFQYGNGTRKSTGAVDGSLTLVSSLTVAGSTFVVQNTGNVGINVASPGALLEIGAGNVGTTPKNVLLSDRADTSVGGGVMFRTLTAVRFGGVNDDSGSESFQLRNNSNVVQMYLGIIGARAGRLGLGTSSPATLFHMSSGTLTIDGNVNPGLRMDPQLQLLISSGSATVPGMAFNGDTNNGFFSPGADIAAMTTGGSERLRVDASGNVGIGVNPAVRLDVQDNGGGIVGQFASNSASAINVRIKNNAAGGDFLDIVADTDGIAFEVNDTVRMKLSDTAGRIGINNTSPGTLLHMSSGTLTIDGNVNPGLRMDPQLQLLVSSGSVSVPGLAINGNANTGLFSTANNVLNFATGGTEAFRINSSARLQIGRQAGMDSGIAFAFDGANTARNTISDGGGDRLNFTAGGGVRLRIETDGSVGINTTADMVPELVVVSSQAATQDVLAVSSQATTTIMFSVRGSGGVMFTQKTKAQFDTLTPTGVGEIFQCSNCTVTYALCHATGTLVAQWGREGSATVGCGSGE